MSMYREEVMVSMEEILRILQHVQQENQSFCNFVMDLQNN
jgi:hypothetical protein